MNPVPAPVVVACNNPPIDPTIVHLFLDYQSDLPARNLSLRLPQFVQNVYHLPDRVLDLVEIAAYLYASDRYSSRGSRTGVEYNSWARSFQIHCRVRDYAFWNQDKVKELLAGTLRFMTGDRSYDLIFYDGHCTPPTSLFDNEQFILNPGQMPVAVLPFSGGLDSLAGAIHELSNTDQRVCLVSHQARPESKKTQYALASALSRKFPRRVNHYRFDCHLKRIRATEETQRTRSFLFTSIAFAIARAHGQNQIYVFENGLTSMNLPRRHDQINARASRTTHPKTIYLLQSFFSLFSECQFKVHLPFLFKTKKDVISEIINGSCADLIPSTVSCSSTYTHPRQATHCGECFQCVDRRIAAYAAGVSDYDHHALYAKDIFSDPVDNPEARTVALDYIRQAVRFYESGLDCFYSHNLSDLADITDYLPGDSTEWEKVERVWHLTHAHAENVHEGLRRIRDQYDDLYQPLREGSLLHLLSRREHLKPELARLIDSITKILSTAVPEMFRNKRPSNEPDLNDKVGALLRTHQELLSEHPVVSFACSKAIPDHSMLTAPLYIESKYIRNNTPPSKVTDGIASDLTKYPDDIHILFIVYDPDRALPNDAQFVHDIQLKGRCTVLILR